MKRYVAGLNQADGSSENGLIGGLFLVRVERLQYRWHRQKPHYLILLTVLEPKSLAGNRFSTRLGCSPRMLWRLNWFLRDFGYDMESLSRNEIDDQQLIGLSGVVRVKHSVVNGTSLVSLEGFAPRQQWKELSGKKLRIKTRTEL
ncbi:MAG TPA: hypothetical protein VFA90_18585 [Terriglobales bacterium]|nr:hypothetical protein [Terriglobales bacterium]